MAALPMMILDGVKLTEGSSSYLVAEIGLNHNKDWELTKKMIAGAKKAGANAVKFQVYITENLMSKDSPAFSIFKELELSKNELIQIQEYCKEVGVTFFATPFCYKTADWLDEMEVPCFKIASMDLNYYDFLCYVAEKGKPMILSTGMSSLGEIEKAVRTIRKTGNEKVILLHCLSKYPAPAEEMNLSMITKLKTLFPELLVGISDHSLDNTMSLAARVLGASVFERHFTLSRELPGPDQRISLEPKDFLGMKEQLSMVDAGLNDVKDERGDFEVAKGARRSLFAACFIRKGTVICPDMMKVLRPGTGISPEFFPFFLGKTVKQDIAEGEAISFDFI